MVIDLNELRKGEKPNWTFLDMMLMLSSAGCWWFVCGHFFYLFLHQFDFVTIFHVLVPQKTDFLILVFCGAPRMRSSGLASRICLSSVWQSPLNNSRISNSCTTWWNTLNNYFCNGIPSPLEEDVTCERRVMKRQKRIAVIQFADAITGMEIATTTLPISSHFL